MNITNNGFVPYRLYIATFKAMTRIGLISDTHNFLDEAVFRHFEQCHEIWHAGDIGNSAVADALVK